MVSSTAQFTDRLPELVESAWDDVVDLLKRWHEDNPDCDKLPCLCNDLDYSGSVSEIIDCHVPVYIPELRELAYFHHDSAMQALTDTYGSIEGNWPIGPFAAGLYTLIEQGVSERWHEEADDIWEELTTKP